MSEAGGSILWLTGLSGAGKTTVARELQARWIARGEAVVLLDGDDVRRLFGDDLGHTREDRRTSAWRNAHLCRALAKEGFRVICATISMFAEVRAWARREIPGYTEVFLDVPEEVRRARDPKGLYRQGRAMAGVDQACELPTRPDLCIVNDGARSIEAIVAEIDESLTFSPQGRPAQ